MKIKILMGLPLIVFMACNTPEKSPAEISEPVVTVDLPYTANYSSRWNDNVSDLDLETVLNSYNAWESGDMAALRSTLADSIMLLGWDGYQFNGKADDLMPRWSGHRDSITLVTITIDAWRKSHSIDKNTDFIAVWYKEVDTYKSGRIDSAYFQDDNMIVNGKIRWYSQHRQELKMK